MKKIFSAFLFPLLFLAACEPAYAGYEAGTADQTLVVPHAGGRAKFGQLDLSQSAAVKNQLPISKGGTGQATANPAFNALSPNTTKGDITVYTGSVNARQAVGTDGQVLVADSSQTNGLKYTLTPSSAMEQLNLGFSASIASNTLVVALKQADGATDPATGTGAVRVGFRSATTTAGAYSEVSFTSATSITLAAADSIGLTAAVSGTLYIYLIADSSNEICLSATSFDESIVQSASALTAGADTTLGTLWCASAHTSKAIRRIGKVNATWSNPNWGTVALASLSGRVQAAPFVKVTSSTTTFAANAETVIVNGTIDYDNTGKYNTSTGEFTAPIDGILTLKCNIFPAAAVATAVNARTSLEIFKNGSAINTFGTYVWQTTGTVTPMVTGSVDAHVVAGDVIKAVMNVNSTGPSWQANGNFATWCTFLIVSN